MTTHYFESTGEAYNATQCFEEIKTGDVLVIKSEGVVGVADTWPVAVTVAYGKLHTPNAGWSLAKCLDGRKAACGIGAAKAAAVELGYAVLD